MPAAGPEREPGRRHKALLLEIRRAYGRRCAGAGGGKAGERPALSGRIKAAAQRQIRPHFFFYSKFLPLSALLTNKNTELIK